MQQLKKSEARPKIEYQKKDNTLEDEEEEEPSIQPPSLKKKKGPTINEMLQNDLETEEEKLMRYHQAQIEEKERVAKLLMDKNQGIDSDIMQADDEGALRYNYQVKILDDSNDLNNLSYNQEIIRDPLQNDLAMLEDDSYLGAQGNHGGGFNGYSSMKRSDNYQIESRPSSSPRNNLMRTYDSQAMTQQFNDGFNYNTSGGGGADDQSQNSQLANSAFAKTENETLFQQQDSYNNEEQHVIQQVLSQEKLDDFSSEVIDEQKQQYQNHMKPDEISDFDQIEHPVDNLSQEKNNQDEQEQIKEIHAKNSQQDKTTHQQEIMGPEEFKDQLVQNQLKPLSPKIQTPISQSQEFSIDYEDPPIQLSDEVEDEIIEASSNEIDSGSGLKNVQEAEENIDQIFQQEIEETKEKGETQDKLDQATLMDHISQEDQFVLNNNNISSGSLQEAEFNNATEQSNLNQSTIKTLVDPDEQITEEKSNVDNYETIEERQQQQLIDNIDSKSIQSKEQMHEVHKQQEQEENSILQPESFQSEKDNQEVNQSNEEIVQQQMVERTHSDEDQNQTNLKDLSEDNLSQTQQQMEDVVENQNDEVASQDQSQKNSSSEQRNEEESIVDEELKVEDDQSSPNAHLKSVSKDENSNNNEGGLFHGSDQMNQIGDFENGSDFGNSISQRDSLQQSSDTIKLMFDALDQNNFKYQSMSKRNLQIDIPETDYSEEEQTHAQMSPSVTQKIEETFDNEEVEILHNDDQEEQEVQEEFEDPDAQDQVSQKQEDEQSHQSEALSEGQHEEVEEEQELKLDESGGDHLESEQNSVKPESPKYSDEQSQLEEIAPQAEELVQEHQEILSQNDQHNQEEETVNERENQSSKISSPKVQETQEPEQKFAEGQNNSIDSNEDEQEEPLQIKQLSENSEEEEVGHQQHDQEALHEIVDQKQSSFADQQSSQNSFISENQKQEFHNSPLIPVPSPLNQPEINDEKDYSIEDYVAEQQDLEIKNKLLNSDMYNLLREKPNENSYKSPKNHQLSISSSNNEEDRDKIIENQQFFYRAPHGDTDSGRRENQINNGEDDQNYLSSGGNFHMQQQHDDQDNEDNYDNIGKWELEKKENEINEIESLDFSVKREDFPDQHYQSNTDQGLKVEEEKVQNEGEQPKVESMHIYVSPEKAQQSRDLFNRKRDSKSRSNPAPLPPSNETKKPLLKSNPSNKQQKQVQEKKSIQKIKDLFSSEEKYQMYERLYQKETSSSQSKKKTIDEDSRNKNNSALKNLTFKPKIDSNSKNMTSTQLDETKASHRNIDPCIFLYHKGVQLREEKKKIQEQQQQLLESENLKACTFKPDIGQSTIQTSSVERPHVSMYERNKYWDDQRKQKIKQEQEKIKASELDECSFAPVIQAHSLFELRSTRQDAADYQYDFNIGQNNIGKSQRSSRSRNNKVGYMQPTQTLTQERSVKMFIERQERAKQQKLEKNNVFLKNDGSHWKNEVTKPKPPKITDIIISNLQKKLNHNFKKHDDQQYQSQRNFKEANKAGRNKLATQQHSRASSVLGDVDQDIMIFDDARVNEVSNNNINNNNKRTAAKGPQFKDQVKFLRQALHQLNLDE